jgi:hypothetical protein
VVAAGVGALCLTPVLVGLRPAAPDDTGSAALMELVRGSTSTSFQGLVQTRGAIGGLDAPVLSDATTALRGSGRLRAWWSSAASWRVATLTATGEQDLYLTRATGLVEWDYGRNRARVVVGTSRLRLPRADDLLPPQAARRLLAGLDGTERLSELPGRRVVGRSRRTP